MSEKISEWLLQNATGELFALFLAAIATLVVSQMRLTRALKRLRAGDHSDLIIVQLNRVFCRNGQPTLILRNLAGGGSITRVFEGNPASINVVHALKQKSDPGRPQLEFSGEEGRQAVHTLVNHVVEGTANASFPLTKVLLTVTCEDKRFLKRTQIRVFVMLEDELLKFLDPKFCVKVQVEETRQSVRVLALHLWAKQFDAQRKSAEANSEFVPKTWLVEIPVRTDYSPMKSVEIDWTCGIEADALSAAGLPARFGCNELFPRSNGPAEVELCADQRG